MIHQKFKAALTSIHSEYSGSMKTFSDLSGPTVDIEQSFFNDIIGILSQMRDIYNGPFHHPTSNIIYFYVYIEIDMNI